MLEIEAIRKSSPQILAIGSYSAIIQSILDFDYLSGKSNPSILGIIKGNKKGERFFWGKNEILVPYFKDLEETGPIINRRINYFLNVASARRALSTTSKSLDTLTGLIGGTLFAEDTPERHSLALFEKIKNNDAFIIGPSSIGILVPETLKLGAVGGVSAKQLLSPIFYER